MPLSCVLEFCLQLFQVNALDKAANYMELLCVPHKPNRYFELNKKLNNLPYLLKLLELRSELRMSVFKFYQRTFGFLQERG